MDQYQLFHVLDFDIYLLTFVLCLWNVWIRNCP